MVTCRDLKATSQGIAQSNGFLSYNGWAGYGHLDILELVQPRKVGAEDFYVLSVLFEITEGVAVIPGAVTGRRKWTSGGRGHGGRSHTSVIHKWNIYCP